MHIRYWLYIRKQKMRKIYGTTHVWSLPYSLSSYAFSIYLMLWKDEGATEFNKQAWLIFLYYCLDASSRLYVIINRAQIWINDFFLLVPVWKSKFFLWRYISVSGTGGISSDYKQFLYFTLRLKLIGSVPSPSVRIRSI